MASRSGTGRPGAILRAAWRAAPAILGAWGVVMVLFLAGFASRTFNFFPASAIDKAIETQRTIRDRLKGKLEWQYVRTKELRTVTVSRPAEMSPGLTLLGGIGPNKTVAAWIVDAQGRTLHKWDLDWFRLWPDHPHVPARLEPKERPGKEIHGVVLSPNGDLTFNFETLGMMQLDICGRVKWRLPRMTHHAINPDERGGFWTAEVVYYDTPLPRFPNHVPPVEDDVVLHVSPDGRVLEQFSMLELLADNGYEGLLYMTPMGNWHTTVTPEAELHFNDVEVFPSTMKPGVFQPGDVMVSLRNINAVVVFDPRTRRIRAITTGRFVRQHDPDFIDGNTISVFDNHNIGARGKAARSRIVEVSFPSGDVRTVFTGTSERRFYTDIMGRHQLLPNGGMLLAETARGHAFEVNAKGETVWEYYNHVEPKVLGLLSEAERIAPATMSPERLKTLAASCLSPRPSGV